MAEALTQVFNYFYKYDKPLARELCQTALQNVNLNHYYQVECPMMLCWLEDFPDEAERQSRDEVVSRSLGMTWDKEQSIYVSDPIGKSRLQIV